MPSEIHISQLPFGKLSEEADVLAIEITEQGIDFCELNGKLHQPLYTTHYAMDRQATASFREQFAGAVKFFQFSKKNYQAVYVNVFTALFTLCPVAFYDPDHTRQLLEFNAGATGETMVREDDVTPDVKLIYGIDDAMKSTLDLIFPHHQMKHSLTVLSQLMLHAEDLAKDQVLLSLHPGHIELVIKQDAKLILANQFAVKTQEDILYYVLFALEQYQLNPATVNLCLAGNVQSDSELVLTLKKYIKNIRLGTGHRSLNWQGVEGMPQHFNYALLNRIFCEL